MFKLAFGFLIGIGISVMHYDFGLSPSDVIDIVAKNSANLVADIEETSANQKGVLAEPLLGMRDIFNQHEG